MDDHDFHERFTDRAARWRHHLRRYGLDGIAAVLLEAADPLSMVGAQVLYVSQPALSTVVGRQALTDWARLLETPGGLAWLRQQLTEDDPNNG